jgi:Amt family ammonium transporter
MPIQEINAGDTAWLLTASGLVLLMTPGLAFFYGGMVKKKNLISTMFQSFVSMGLVSVLWVVVGFSLAFGESLGGVIGNPLTYLGLRNVGVHPNPTFAATIPFALFVLFQMKFAIITPALITGAFAERVRFKSYLIFCVFFSLFIYTPLAHWAWHPEGFLRKWGVLDFAGGTVVHISAGIAALVAALMMRGRQDRTHAPSNIPFVLLGTGMLWFGWFGFNAGSALAANGQAVQAFLTTNTASATAMLVWVLLDWKLKKKPSCLGACVGAVVGLVAITPAAGYVSFGASLFIGAVASVISYSVVIWRAKKGIDDTLDVFPCHGVGGIVGMLLTAVFAEEGGLIYGSSVLLLKHMAALSLVVVFVVVMTWIGLKLVRLIEKLEVSVDGEELGLDLHQHNEQLAH